jgi:hypothetical protein
MFTNDAVENMKLLVDITKEIHCDELNTWAEYDLIVF